MKIKILYLYKDLMNLYGEYANITILKKYLNISNVDVQIDYKSINEEKNFNEYDLIYAGSSTERSLIRALEDLRKDKEALKDYIENDGFVLFTGNSYEILGSSIDQLEGLNILPFTVKTIDRRITTDVIFKTDLIEEEIVGFINNSSIITNNDYYLFKSVFSLEETIKTEGVHYKNLYATHLTGPFLMRNPYFLKYFINQLCIKKYSDFKLIDKDYELLNESYEIVLEELTLRNEK